MPNKFKTMTLVEEGELERLRQRQIREYNPTLRSLGQTQEQIEKLLGSTDLEDEGKFKILNQLQEKFGYLYNKFKNSSAGAKIMATPGDSVAVAAADPNQDNQAGDADGADGAQDSMEADPGAMGDQAPFPPVTLPAIYSKKFELFKKFLADHPNDFTSNSKKELVIDGAPLPNSYAPDLFRSLYLRSTKANLLGHANLITKLHQLNADPDMFSNKKVLNFLSYLGKKPPAHSSSKAQKGTVFSSKPQKGSGFSFPPGKRPRILHVYRL